MSTTHTAPAPSQTQTVANRLVELCNSGKHEQAMRDLYADNCRHVEAMECPGSPYGRIIEGKANLLKMAEHWSKTTTVHDFSCGKPLVNGDQFVVEMKLDSTSTEGPFANQRMKVSEQALYTVTNGKITEAKFFYGMC